MKQPRKYSFGQILDIFRPYILLIAVEVALILFWLLRFCSMWFAIA